MSLKSWWCKTSEGWIRTRSALWIVKRSLVFSHNALYLQIIQSLFGIQMGDNFACLSRKSYKKALWACKDSWETWKTIADRIWMVCHSLKLPRAPSVFRSDPLDSIIICYHLQTPVQCYGQRFAQGRAAPACRIPCLREFLVMTDNTVMLASEVQPLVLQL